jgi:UPF0176 protein
MQSDYEIILFYRFVTVADPEATREREYARARTWGLTGRMLIATEGINATFEGTSEAIANYCESLSADPLFAQVVFKRSVGTGNAFSGLKVKVRPEVVTLGVGDFDVAAETAPGVSAAELSQWYETDPDFVVLDLRNTYEIEAGHFERTVDPGLSHFRDLPSRIESIAHLKNKKVVAVCTGGIRCEKATCLLKREGFTNVYQLTDGIHTYIQEFPGERFKGTLFVFDNRMTTVVADSPKREVVGKCAWCGVPCENIYSDDAFRPSKKVIACDDCVQIEGAHLRPTQQLGCV